MHKTDNFRSYFVCVCARVCVCVRVRVLVRVCTKTLVTFSLLVCPLSPVHISSFVVSVNGQDVRRGRDLINTYGTICHAQ